MSDSALPQSPGERLARLRQQAGKSLEQVAEATKIPPAMLEAIELDEYHKISGDLYVKSFLRSYAGEVGIEAEEILAQYAAYTGAAAEGQAGQDPAVWHDEEVQVQRLGVPWKKAAGLGLAAILVLLLIWFAWSRLAGGSDGDGEQDGVSERLEQSAAPAKGAEGSAQGSLLAGGPLENAAVGQSEADPSSSGDGPAGGGTAESEPAPADVSAGQESNASPQPADRGSSTPQTTPDIRNQTSRTGPMPAPLVGDPGRLKLDGRSWPVVLRVICPQPSGVTLKKDADREFSPVNWPEQSRPLPGPDDLRAGWGYHVNEGLVVYWGAEDHFSLKADDPRGLKASVNGEYRDIGSLGPGQEIILNDPEVIRSNLPSARDGR